MQSVLLNDGLIMHVKQKPSEQEAHVLATLGMPTQFR